MPGTSTPIKGRPLPKAPTFSPDSPQLVPRSFHETRPTRPDAFNGAQFLTHWPSKPGCHTGRDHRIAPLSDSAEAEPTQETRSQPRPSLPVGLVVKLVVGLALLLNHREARNRFGLGIVKDSAGIGLVRFATDDRDALEFRKKLAI